MKEILLKVIRDTRLWREGQTELFYIYNLLFKTPFCRFKFIDYGCYFKNRFFGERILSSMPNYWFTPEDDLEVHILCGKKDLTILAWALKSFLYYSGLKPKIIIHNDGTLTFKFQRLIELKFSNLTVVNSIKLEGTILLKKLIDVFASAKANNVIVMDSDIIFYKRPREMIDFIKNDKIKALATASRNGEFCSGLILVKKELLDINKLQEYLKDKDLNDYFVEQNAWKHMLQDYVELLPSDTYTIKYPPNEHTVMKHFTGPRRQELYAYGIDRFRRNMETDIKKGIPSF